MIDNCVFDTSGIWTEGPGIRSYIKHNNFLNAINAAIYINTGTSNSIDISYNNFKNNKVAIIIGAVSPTGVQISRNNFYMSNGTNLNIQAKDDMTASNNWWGTTDFSIINLKIHDFYDHFDLGKINYQPIVTSRIPNAGVR